MARPVQLARHFPHPSRPEHSGLHTPVVATVAPLAPLGVWLHGPTSSLSLSQHRAHVPLVLQGQCGLVHVCSIVLLRTWLSSSLVVLEMTHPEVRECPESPLVVDGSKCSATCCKWQDQTMNSIVPLPPAHFHLHHEVVLVELQYLHVQPLLQLTVLVEVV